MTGKTIYLSLTGLVVGKLVVMLLRETDPQVIQFCAIGLAINLVGATVALLLPERS